MVYHNVRKLSHKLGYSSFSQKPPCPFGFFGSQLVQKRDQSHGGALEKQADMLWWENCFACMHDHDHHHYHHCIRHTWYVQIFYAPLCSRTCLIFFHATHTHAYITIYRYNVHIPCTSRAQVGCPIVTALQNATQKSWDEDHGSGGHVQKNMVCSVQLISIWGSVKTCDSLIPI